MQQFLKILKEEEEEEEEKFLSTKTSFGRNDLRRLLAEVKSNALVKYFEEKPILKKEGNL